MLQTFQSARWSAHSPLCEVLQSASVTLTCGDDASSTADAVLTTHACTVPAPGRTLQLIHSYVCALVFFSGLDFFLLCTAVNFDFIVCVATYCYALPLDMRVRLMCVIKFCLLTYSDASSDYCGCILA